MRRLPGALAGLPVRVRLVAGFAAAMIVVLTGAGAFVWWRVEYALDKRLEADLASQAADLRSAAARRSPQAALAAVGAQARLAQLLDADGSPLATGAELRGRPPLLSRERVRMAVDEAVSVERGDLFSARGEHLRLRAVPVRAVASRRAAVALTFVRLDQRDEALRELLLQLAVANLVALALASLVGYRVARGALDPVERYREQAERIAQGATGVRLAVPAERGDEITRLGATLNAMLAAQERAAERQQQFVDDASHELRTPLSALSVEVELALRRPRSAEELTGAVRRIGSDTSRLVALADELLALGALGSAAPAAVGTAAGPRLEAAAARARAELPASPPRVVLVDAAADLELFADPALLDRALGNLVDNAVRHGAGTVTLSAAALEEAGGTVVRVHDQGTGLGADFLPHAAERFRRQESSRTGRGTGLGMALVDAIAGAHGGQLRICAADHHHRRLTADLVLARVPCIHPRHGTTVSVLLPDGPLH